MSETRKLAVGTRYYAGNPNQDPGEANAQILTWVDNASTLTGDPTLVNVAVNTKADLADTANMLRDTRPDINVIEVMPWDKFVAPLNALIQAAALQGAQHLFSVSADYYPTTEQTQTLLDHMDDNTLMAGAALYGHDFLAGRHRGVYGKKTPWMTTSMINLSMAMHTGIPLGGDAPWDPTRNFAGIEEVLFIKFQQELYGAAARKAKLIALPGYAKVPDKSKWDQKRIDDEPGKLESKNTRSREQLARAGFNAGVDVEHFAA